MSHRRTETINQAKAYVLELGGILLETGFSSKHQFIRWRCRNGKVAVTFFSCTPRCDISDVLFTKIRKKFREAGDAV